MRRYLLAYDPGTGSRVEWVKTLEELLAPNGEDCLLVYMLKRAHESGTPFELLTVDAPAEGFPEGYIEEVRLS